MNREKMKAEKIVGKVLWLLNASKQLMAVQ